MGSFKGISVAPLGLDIVLNSRPGDESPGYDLSPRWGFAFSDLPKSLTNFKKNRNLLFFLEIPLEKM